MVTETGHEVPTKSAWELHGVYDPHGAESEHRTEPELGLLPVEAELVTEKRLAGTRGRVLEHGVGVRGCLAGLPAEGYEIHIGRSRARGRACRSSKWRPAP